MGVLPCDRVGCDNIMCDRLGAYRGIQYYICDRCFDELVRIGPQADVESFMEGGLIESFDPDASRAYFDSIFPIMRGSPRYEDEFKDG